MELQTPVTRVLWVDHTVEGLTHEIISIRAQVRAIVLSSLALDRTDQSLADLLHQQLELMERQCALVRGQLAHLHADLTGGHPAGTSAAASTAAPDPQRAVGEPNEP